LFRRFHAISKHFEENLKGTSRHRGKASRIATPDALSVRLPDAGF
jgi:hypothetical protein